MEIIHTDGDRLGLLAPIGDADFYPHYGKYQPGCELDLTGGCSHERAHTYFAESLNANNRFISVRCSSFFEIRSKTCSATEDGIKMGGDLPNFGLNGIFYLDINAGPPYAQG